MIFVVLITNKPPICKWRRASLLLHYTLGGYMTREEIEACWRDRRNRKWCFYYCKAAPRVIVPKRYKWMGWTINAAHPSAIPVLLLLIVLVVAPIRIVESAGAGSAARLLTAAASITVLCFLCAYLSSRTS